ncbi:hypothetical protein ScPMuIL_001169 [Solemya velum]
MHQSPSFTEKDVYNYFVLKMKTKRMLRSKVYYEDGHVFGVQYNEVTADCSHCVIRAKVMPSLPKANEKQNPNHDTWLIMSKETGNVHSANCDCTAGKGESCNHIAAVMYALVDISDKKSEGKLASTSQKQKWNVPRKRKISPKKVQNVKFRKYSSRPNSGTSNVKSTLFRTPDEKVKSHVDENFQCTVDVKRLADKLKKTCPDIGWLNFFVKKKESNTECIPTLHDITYQLRDGVDLSATEFKRLFNNIFEKLSISEEECNLIEKLTQGQSNNSVWHDARKERITSSQFGSVCKLRPDTQPDCTLRSVLGYKPFHSIFTKWGIKHEAAARKQYEKKQNVTVVQSGLIINREFPYLGTSPDGLIGKEGVLEIKCPAAETWRTKIPEDCAKENKFYCFLDKENKIRLKDRINISFKYRVSWL